MRTLVNWSRSPYLEDLADFIPTPTPDHYELRVDRQHRFTDEAKYLHQHDLMNWKEKVEFNNSWASLAFQPISSIKLAFQPASRGEILSPKEHTLLEIEDRIILYFDGSVKKDNKMGIGLI